MWCCRWSSGRISPGESWRAHCGSGTATSRELGGPETSGAASLCPSNRLYHTNALGEHLFESGVRRRHGRHCRCCSASPRRSRRSAAEVPPPLWRTGSVQSGDRTPVAASLLDERSPAQNGNLCTMGLRCHGHLSSFRRTRLSPPWQRSQPSKRSPLRWSVDRAGVDGSAGRKCDRHGAPAEMSERAGGPRWWTADWSARCRHLDTRPKEQVLDGPLLGRRAACGELRANGTLA